MYTKVSLHKQVPEELPVHEPLFLFGFPHQVQCKKLLSHHREMNRLKIMSCHTATLINREGLLQVSVHKTNLYNSFEPEDHIS